MTDPTPAIGLVLDCCSNPERLAEFWAPALGYVNLGTAGSYVLLLPNGKPGPKLILQQVPEAKSVKNRKHLDIETADIEAEATRLEALGAPTRPGRPHPRARHQLDLDERPGRQRVLRLRRWRPTVTGE
jgi:Glyoxalase-like domain